MFRLSKAGASALWPLSILLYLHQHFPLRFACVRLSLAANYTIEEDSIQQLQLWLNELKILVSVQKVQCRMYLLG